MGPAPKRLLGYIPTVLPAFCGVVSFVLFASDHALEHMAGENGFGLFRVERGDR